MAGETIGIYGAGAWGAALAVVAARSGNEVLLVGRDEAVVEAIVARRETPHLPGIVLPPAVRAGTDPAVLRRAAVVVSAVPAQATRTALLDLAPNLSPGSTVVSAAKGIERSTGLLVSEVIAGIHGSGPVAVLSGPGFAGEVSRGLPTAVTIAAEDDDLAERLCRLFAAPGFRPYASSDVVGVQLGGALKNVLAIAAGVVAGRALGASAQAAVITRGFVELRRLAAAWGARPDTLMGLSGLGDLILTCQSVQSRNFALGVAIGRGEDPAGFGKLAEGAATAGIAVERGEVFGIDLPIMGAVTDVLEGRTGVDEAVDLLLARPLKREDAI